MFKWFWTIFSLGVPGETTGFCKVAISSRNQIVKVKNGLYRKKKGTTYFFFIHLHYRRKCYLVNVVYQYHHMSNRTLARASRAGRKLVGGRLSFTKTLPILVVLKTVRLLRPATKIVIWFRRHTLCRVLVKFDKRSTDTVELIAFASPNNNGRSKLIQTPVFCRTSFITSARHMSVAVSEPELRRTPLGNGSKLPRV